jgi:hypothetical protein
MAHTALPRTRKYRVALIFAFFTAAPFLLMHSASAQCAGPGEEGRWRNLDNAGEPSFIDVKMLGCGDESLNGAAPQESHCTMRAWVKQSTGKFYGRPTVSAIYRPWKNTKMAPWPDPYRRLRRQHVAAGGPTRR